MTTRLREERGEEEDGDMSPSGLCSLACPSCSLAVLSVLELGSLAIFSVRPPGALSSDGRTGMVNFTWILDIEYMSKQLWEKSITDVERWRMRLAYNV